MSLHHHCPVPGCEAVISDDRLLCRAHWARVPRHIQRAVYAAWNAFQSSKGQYTAVRVAAHNEWLRQRGFALAAAQREEVHHHAAR
jgi:hypothetical protein